MSFTFPILEVHVERSRTALRVVARGVSSGSVTGGSVTGGSVTGGSVTGGSVTGGVASSGSVTSGVALRSSVTSSNMPSATAATRDVAYGNATSSKLNNSGVTSGDAQGARTPQDGVTPLLLLEAMFSTQDEGVSLRLTHHGAVRGWSQEAIARHPALSAVVRLIADEAESISRGRARAAGQELLALLCRGLLMYVQRMDNVVALPLPRSLSLALRGPGGGRDARIERALELLDADISRRWTVESLARAAGLSRPAFARQFLRTLGLSPMRYITQRRLHIAAGLLQSSDAALAEIAARVGYRSEFAFSRAFRKQFQMPPGVYRQRPPTGLVVAQRMAA